MNDGAIGLLIIFGVIGGLFGLVWLDFKICDWANKLNEAKHHKEHPEFFRLRDEYSEKVDTACRFHNTEIAPRKRKVDYMLKEEPYWPQEVREQKMEEVEKLRREIYTAECMCKGLDKEAEEVREKVVNYIHTHNIKWAGKWD